MANIRIVTDSASDLPQDVADRLNIDVVSLSVRFGEDEFTDRVDLTSDEFWAKCKASKTLPETAAPSPGAFQLAYERALSDGCDGVLVIALSEALSATHQSAMLAKNAVAEKIPVRVVDSQAVSMAQGLLAIEVAEFAKTGASLDDLEKLALELTNKIGVVAMLDTLEHLQKGGRVGGAKALMGQVLSIKPLIELKDGIVSEAGRQRTKAKALAAIADVARENAPLRRLALMHGASDQVEALTKLVSDILSEFPLLVTDIGPVVGTHGGPGVIALAWVRA